MPALLGSAALGRPDSESRPYIDENSSFKQ
jgi:hypothetical protein